MLALAIAVVAAALLVGIGSLVLGRSRRDDDVQRFHRAAGLTAEWARSGVGRPNLVDDAAAAEGVDRPAGVDVA